MVRCSHLRPEAITRGFDGVEYLLERREISALFSADPIRKHRDLLKIMGREPVDLAFSIRPFHRIGSSKIRVDMRWHDPLEFPGHLNEFALEHLGAPHFPDAESFPPPAVAEWRCLAALIAPAVDYGSKTILPAIGEAKLEHVEIGIQGIGLAGNTL
ncbi:hypothetical protein [Labrys miyagiensis]